MLKNKLAIKNLDLSFLKPRTRHLLGVDISSSSVKLVELSRVGKEEGTYQQGRNEYLKNQIAVLDRQIEEINKIKGQTQTLLARKKVVESLQDNRAGTVHLLDQIVRLIPDGVYLKSIKQAAQNISLAGYAQSNARVSTMMRNLDASPWLDSSSLVEIKATNVNNARLNEFNLNVSFSNLPEGADSKPQ